MASSQGRRVATVLVPVALVVAVVVAVLTLGGSDDPGDGGAGQRTGPTDPPSSAAAPLASDAWCALFRAFADANTAYVATPGEQTAAAMVAAADELVAAGPPLGLSDGGFAGLRALVAGALTGVGGPTEVPPTPPPDQAALDQYLATSCPAGFG